MCTGTTGVLSEGPTAGRWAQRLAGSRVSVGILCPGRRQAREESTSLGRPVFYPLSVSLLQRGYPTPLDFFFNRYYQVTHAYAK